MKTFQPIVNEIQSVGKSDEYDLNQISEIVVIEDSLTFVSGNILRNQLKGLSEVKTGNGHVLRNCLIRDFSPTGAARTFGFDLQALIRYELTEKSDSARDIVKPYQRYIYHI